MKTLIATTAIAVAAFAGVANASTSAIQFYAPNADVSVLTEAQVNKLLSVIHSGDTESEKRNAVQAALR